MAGGRPSKYTDDLATLICRRLADGESLSQICRDDKMPDRHTVIAWKNAQPEFRASYARAREDQADSYADRALDEALNAEDAQKARLAFDALRWAAGKLKPGTYGDKVQHANAAGDGDTTVVYRWGDGSA